jgi:hypothetical protein
MKYLVVFFSAALGFSLAACSGGSSGGGTGGMTGSTDAGHDAGTGGKGTGGKGMGGAQGMGGAAGSAACLAPKYSHVSTFGAILDSWVVASNSTPGTLAPIPGGDAGTPGGGTKVEIDTTDGMPRTPVLGSVKLTIPFDQPNEEMLFANNSNGLNMMGQTITAYIKLDSGLNTGPVNVGKAFLILKTTAAYNYVAGPTISLDPSAGWVQLSIDANNPQPALPPGYDPCDVREIDISIQTGGTGTYTTAVVHIDTISIAGPGGVVDDAGTDAAPDTGSTVDAPVDMASDTAPDTATGG